MSNKTKYRIIIAGVTVCLLIAGVVIGIVVSMKNHDDSYIVKKEPIIEDEVNVYQTVSTKTYDIELTYIDYYKLCNEKIESKEIVYGITLDKLKEQEVSKQKEKKLEYNIEEESNERLVYKRVINSNCPNHFNVKLEEGVVNIYNVVDDSVSTLYKTIDISQELIRPELLEELNEGIKANSQLELNLIIEDIES
ncbi:MAG: hypothetical protein PHP54_02040 [Clostridia bacterium]|nr:hypothetical protein [Clostridia bacterium]